MNHAITLGDLLLVLALIGGIGTTLYGALLFFAGSMADAPAEGDAAGKRGCMTFFVGAVVLIGSLWALLS